MSWKKKKNCDNCAFSTIKGSNLHCTQVQLNVTAQQVCDFWQKRKTSASNKT